MIQVDSDEMLSRASSQETLHASTLASHTSSSSDVPSDTSSDDVSRSTHDLDDTLATSNDEDLASGKADQSADVSRVDELHQQIVALFDRFVPTSHEETHDGTAEPTLLSRDLPTILKAFEEQQGGYALIDPKAYIQFEAFIDENPDVPITSGALVNLIHALEASAHSEEVDDAYPDSLPDIAAGRANSSSFSDTSQDEFLIRDQDSSRELSREHNPENAIILDMREDLRTEREKSDALLQSLSDRERKINNLEAKLVTLQEHHEETVLEHESSIKELTDQVYSLKKDERESRLRLEEVQQQTVSYEAELAALTVRLGASEKANAKLKGDLEDETQAAQQTKEDLDRRIKESRELSDYLEECERARDTAEERVQQLKQDLDRAVADGERLQEYKEEVEELRSTADKLEMELDEARRVAALYTTTDSAMQQQSNPPTISRRLGNELARRLEVQSESSGNDTETDEKHEIEDVDDFIETVVQRRRRRVGKSRTSLELATQSVQTDDVPEAHKAALTEKASLHPAKVVETQLWSLLQQNKVLAFVAAIFSIGTALGLMFNTSRDIYHVNHLSLDAEQFRRLNFLPNTSKTLYYDNQYPRAVVGSNFADDYLASILDTVFSAFRPLRLPSRSPNAIYY